MIMATVQVGGSECSAADVNACLQVLEPQAKSRTTFAAIQKQLGAKNLLAKADWRASHPGVRLTTKGVLITVLKELLKTAEMRRWGYLVLLSWSISSVPKKTIPMRVGHNETMSGQIDLIYATRFEDAEQA